MTMGVPESWSKSAMMVLERDRRGTEGAVSEKIAKEMLAHFTDREFREKYFNIIGHRYVLALHKMLTVEPATKRFTQTQWRTKLGVDKATIWRWKNEISLAGAEKFFAMQLLLVDIPLAELTLPSNNQMLVLSVAAMFRYLKNRYDPLNVAEPFSLEMFRRVNELMWVMSQSETTLYNPFSNSQTPKSKQLALEALAKHFETKRNSPIPQNVLPSHIKMWLDGWGMTYTLFSMGNRLGWKQIQEG